MKPQDRARYLMHSRTPGFARRVERARGVLLAALDAADGDPTRVAVFTSWGADSVPLCDLALDTIGAGAPLVHMRSPFPMPGGERVVEHFAARARLVTIEPDADNATILSWLHLIGTECDREEKGDQKAGNRMKASKGAEWSLANGCAAQVLGMRADETLSRRRLFAARGPIYRARGLTMACPLASWSVADVWAYTTSRGLPWHPLYDCEGLGFTRETLSNTSWITTHGVTSGRIAWLRRYYPDLHARLVAEWPHLRGLG